MTKMKRLLLVFLLSCLANKAHGASSPLLRPADDPEERAFCPESYSPCTCDSTANGLEVICKDVTIAQIQDVFYRTKTRDIYSLVLTTTAGTPVSIPEEIMSGKRSKHIYMRCPELATKLKLAIHQYAFRLSRDYTEKIEISNCDLSGPDDTVDTDDQPFIFLTDFSFLKELTIQNSLGLTRLQSLPQLGALTSLTIINAKGLVKTDGTAAAFPILTPARATRLTLSDCGLTDSVADIILSTVFRSTSASSLTYLNMSRNAMSTIPAQIPSFARLSDLDLTGNTISKIVTGTLSFTAPVKTIYLNGVGITSMEAGSFSGDFTRAQIHLQDNKLQEFRSDVFKDVLMQMAVQPVSSGAFINVDQNPLVCGCKLAWLIQDSGFVPFVRNGKCCDFFKLEDLNASSFADCPPYKKAEDEL